MICPKCKSTEVNVQVCTDVKVKNRGCFGWLLWILLAVCTFGIILIVPLLTNSKVRSRNYTIAICQNCGNKWRV